MQYHLDKFQLVKYIIQFHRNNIGSDISPVKLQKSLYLLYAMWAGNVRMFNRFNSSGLEHPCEDYRDIFEDLFYPNFYAWKYGAVDPQVPYSISQIAPENNSTTHSNNDIFHSDLNDIIVPFINETLEEIFTISDFTLIDIVQDDMCWQEVFEIDPSGNTKINPDKIKNEYYHMLI